MAQEAIAPLNDDAMRSTYRWLRSQRRRSSEARALRWCYSALTKALPAGWREYFAARIGGLRDLRKPRAIAGRAFDFRRHGFRLQILHDS
jgi:hypothetical protein